MLAWLPASAWVIVIWIGSSRSQPLGRGVLHELTIGIFGLANNIALHAVEYAILSSLLLLGSFSGGNIERAVPRCISIMGISSIVAAVDEIIQLFVLNRDGSMGDFWIDVLSVSVVIICFLAVAKIIRQRVQSY